MTTPRFLIDPQNGVPYLYGAPLPSAHASSILDALRRGEKAAYLSLVQNWKPVTFLPANLLVAAFDATLGAWAFIDSSSIDLGFSGPALLELEGATTVPAYTTTPVCGAGSDLGCFVVGMASAVATTGKIIQSNDGKIWTTRNIGASNTKSVAFIEWSATGGRFVALVSTGEAYTSPDGVTWTQRTVPAGLAGALWTGLSISSTGLCVATANGTTNYMTSADGGTTWVQRTGPANGDTVAYSPGVSLGTGGFAWGISHVSADGVSWSPIAAAPKFATAGSSRLCRILGIGPMFVAVTIAQIGSAVSVFVESAYDQANPSSWSLAANMTVLAANSPQVVGSNVFASKNQLFVSVRESLGAGKYFASHSLGY